MRTVGESLTGARIRGYIERHPSDTSGVDDKEHDDGHDDGQLDLF